MVFIYNKVRENAMQITCQGGIWYVCISNDKCILRYDKRQNEFPLGPFYVADYLWHAAKKAFVHATIA